MITFGLAGAGSDHKEVEVPGSPDDGSNVEMDGSVAQVIGNNIDLIQKPKLLKPNKNQKYNRKSPGPIVGPKLLLKHRSICPYSMLNN